MQQFTILPINVSQKSEMKNQSHALISTSPKEEFSQHVDLHSAKNKGGINDSNQSREAKSHCNTVREATKSSKDKLAHETSSTSPSSLSHTDRADTASGGQELAASGKQDEKVYTTIQTESADETEEHVKESDVLMSFLIKADNTLVTKNLASSLTNNEMSVEQMAKYEAQLLLKSSGLVADLSAITQALNSSPELELSELKQAAQELHQADKLSQMKAESAQAQIALQGGLTQEGEDDQNSIVTKVASLEGEIANGDILAKAKQALNSTLTANKQNDQGEDEITIQEQIKLSGQNKLDELLVNQELTKGALSANDEKHQQLASLNKITDKEQLSAKSLLNAQAMDSAQKVVGAENDATEKVGSLIGNNLNIDKSQAERLARTTLGADSVASNKQSSQNYLAQGVSGQVQAAQDYRVTDQANTFPNDQGADDTQLRSQSVEHDIAKSKGATSDKHIEVGKQVVTNSSSDFSIHSDLADITSKASQASQHLADQQANDLFNPRASSEISQSQKTNTQLHNETISIFRKDFADAVKDKVMLVISQKLQQFDITLDPPELGNIHVKVNLQGEQASVNFVVNNQQAKDAFEQNMHKLKELLAEQGVDVGDTNVEQQSQQSNNQAENEEIDTDNNRQSMKITSDADDIIEHDLSESMISSSSAVDYYA